MDKCVFTDCLMKIDWHILVPLMVAFVLGGLIGLEREMHHKSAGLRTNILICLGAATFMVMGREGLAGPDAISRMTAGIVTGVGFIGGGALIRGRTSVHGLTTAATIWIVTGIGIACGLAMYEIATAVTILTLIVLWGLSPLDRKLNKSTDESQES
ncbi:MAG: MgtC/SapB family protein [Planctomycetota bacterium]|jgi:putative Mg2+ transporter-C (MgtC) family protein